jgi:hypothetical protein
VYRERARGGASWRLRHSCRDSSTLNPWAPGRDIIDIDRLVGTPWAVILDQLERVAAPLMSFNRKRTQSRWWRA